MYHIQNNKATKVEAVSFSELGMVENDIEEILRNSIDMLCDDEESMLIVGRQVKNEKNGRSDLTAIDNYGNIVLIEIKRDRKDIEHRKEAFEFQAIRYAANYATIKSAEELVKKIYASYIEKYLDEFEPGELTSYELGIRKLNEFLTKNEVQNTFNQKQKIILVASGFDEQTLSAVAWLNSNNVDMSCFKLTPYKISNDIYWKVEKLLPLTTYDDYYVNVMDTSPIGKQNKDITRRSLPKIDALLEWGVVQEGDVIVAKDREDEGTLLKNGNVNVNGQELTLQTWLKEVYGWSSVETYKFAIHKPSNKSLADIRREYMESQIEEGINQDSLS